MSYVLATMGGKGKGLADQVTIDPGLGCKNRCVGCYAYKSSQRGRKYNEVYNKEMDIGKLKRSIRKVKKEGIDFCRVGKHCDPGDHIPNLISIIDCCTDEDFRCIVVSKSLRPLDVIKDGLSHGKHLLHMSLGPFSQYAPPEEEILSTAKSYQEAGVDTSLRWTRDVTLPMNSITKAHIKTMPCIVTPMRYASRVLMNTYGSDERNFSFVDGYFRPKKVHKDWTKFTKTFCGEINGVVKCCNCNI